MLMGINNIAAITMLALIIWWIYEVYLVITGKLVANLISEVDIAPNKTQNKNVKSFQIDNKEEPLIAKKIQKYLHL